MITILLTAPTATVMTKSLHIFWMDYLIHTVLNAACNKKLSYHRWTARYVVSVEILQIATQQCRHYLYDKS